MVKKLLVPSIISCCLFLLLRPIFAHLTANLHPIVLLVVFVCIFVATTAIYLFVWKLSITIPRSLFYGCFFLYTVALLILLFIRPNDTGMNSVNLLPFDTIHFYFSGNVHWVIAFYNLAANIGLFIPFGFLFRTTTSNKLFLLSVPFLLVSAIELSQYLTRRGSLDMDDLILNVLGFYIGYALYPRFQRVLILR
ncbi:VanZ family protein [Sutcliffiella horikoshii]|uniref:VanZ family protein n=1 Tax=Sutcliffiella horikoshii TaxID=79883 RepID=UPI001F394E19|nr:VanZ family protein [Sutcliffiella horikoshii]MCG1021271.1 VanZ family protein [Sutcliffiella horikoshii]